MSGRILESYANYVWTRRDLSSLQPTDRQQLFVFIIQLHEVEHKLRSNRVKISGDIVQLFIRCRKKGTCLTSRLRALRFSFRFAFTAP